MALCPNNARQCWKLLALGVVTVAVMTWGARASAQAGQWTAGPRAGASLSAGTEFNPSVGAEVGTTVDEAIRLQLSVDVSGHHGVRPSLTLMAPSDVVDEAEDGVFGKRLLLRAMTGASYRFDVLRWVPYLRVELGYIGSYGGEDESAHGLGFGAGGGVDYLISREWSVGVNYLFVVAPEALASRQVLDTQLHLLHLAVDYHWGL